MKDFLEMIAQRSSGNESSDHSSGVFLEQFVSQWLDENRAERAVAEIRKLHIDVLRSELGELRRCMDG